MGNRSLDDFLDAGSDDSGDESGDDGDTDASERDTDDGNANASERAASSDAADQPDGEPQTDTESESGVASEAPPAVSTYAWHPEGGECEACGATVERRWRQDEALVCPDCKEW